jgi:hypothetical protein
MRDWRHFIRRIPKEITLTLSWSRIVVFGMTIIFFNLLFISVNNKKIKPNSCLEREVKINIGEDFEIAWKEEP